MRAAAASVDSVCASVKVFLWVTAAAMASVQVFMALASIVVDVISASILATIAVLTDAPFQAVAAVTSGAAVARPHGAAIAD